VVPWFATAPLSAADWPLVLADGRGSVLIGPVFALEQGQDEIEAIALAAGVALFGLLLSIVGGVIYALTRMKRLGEDSEQTRPAASRKILPAVLALLGIGFIVGAVIFGQVRLIQIDAAYATKRVRPK
jgi:hypothetical protein